jgi:hypothetical protein
MFNVQDEPRGKPPKRSYEEIDTLLKNWKECPAPGKKRKAPAPGENKEKAPTPLLGVWKRKSAFWDLPYWKILGTPHSLDAMHITKNVCESLLGTLLNMPDSTKDGPNARNDLIMMGIKKELHGGCPAIIDQQEEMEGHKGKKVKRKDYYCPPPPLLLHSKSE